MNEIKKAGDFELDCWGNLYNLNRDGKTDDEYRETIISHVEMATDSEAIEGQEDEGGFIISNPKVIAAFEEILTEEGLQDPKVLRVFNEMLGILNGDKELQEVSNDQKTFKANPNGYLEWGYGIDNAIKEEKESAWAKKEEEFAKKQEVQDKKEVEETVNKMFPHNKEVSDEVYDNLTLTLL